MKLLFCACFFLSLGAFPQSTDQVLFLEVKNNQGESIKLEPDFPYAHVLISVEGKWAHSHPRTGVQIIESAQIKTFGQPAEWVELQLPSEASKHLMSWLDLPYDSSFQWTDDKFYCSELVAKLLQMEPEPMHFDPKLWPPSFQELEGLPGVSPGKIYQYLKAKGFSFFKE